MAKKKTTYYQAVLTTTDICDDDLVAPCVMEPTTDRKKSAIEIMSAIEEAFGHITDKGVGPDSIIFEYRHVTGDTDKWETKVVKSMARNKKFLSMLEDGLADGSILTVMVTVPEYLNYCLTRIEKRVDVFHINSFQL